MRKNSYYVLGPQKNWQSYQPSSGTEYQPTARTLYGFLNRYFNTSMDWIYWYLDEADIFDTLMVLQNLYYLLDEAKMKTILHKNNVCTETVFRVIVISTCGWRAFTCPTFCARQKMFQWWSNTISIQYNLVNTQYKRQNKININTETSSRVIDRSSSGWKAYIDLQKTISEMIKHQNMKCYEKTKNPW